MATPETPVGQIQPQPASSGDMASTGGSKASDKASSLLKLSCFVMCSVEPAWLSLPGGASLYCTRPNAAADAVRTPASVLECAFWLEETHVCLPVRRSSWQVFRPDTRCAWTACTVLLSDQRGRGAPACVL